MLRERLGGFPALIDGRSKEGKQPKAIASEPWHLGLRKPVVLQKEEVPYKPGTEEYIQHRSIIFPVMFITVNIY